jgi:hypothetical protein
MANLIAEAERQTLVRVVQVAFPHQTFPVGPYQRAADAVIDQSAGDPRLLGQLLQGLAELDQQRDVPFTELDDEIGAAVLRSVDGTAFLTGIVDAAIVAFYSDPEVWDLLGYEGPSFDKGGYLDRGFDDLDWLPDPQIEYEEEVAS